MQDHLIEDQTEESPLDAKRRAAIAYLGENHIAHPNYKFRERHAFSAARWAPHSVLRPIQLAAMQAGRL